MEAPRTIIAVNGSAASVGSSVTLASGTVTLQADGSFEYAPALNFHGADSFTYTINGGSSATVYLAVVPANDAPLITSDGAGGVANKSVPENGTAVTTVVALDVDGPTTFTYALSGADAALFSIDNAGVLAFLSGRDFETPADSDANNVYDVLVEVSDGSLSAIQALAVSVTNVNESPSFTSGPATIVFAENSVTSTAVATYTTSDPDDGTTLIYALSGADAALFSISAAGVVSFQASPNFESPVDSGANNIYDVLVEVSDGSLSATQALAVSVTNVNESPSFTSGPTTASFAENTVQAEAVAAYSTSDPDAGATLTYTLSGADAALFNIDTTGVVTFLATPNFESPADSENNNVYDVLVEVSDGSLSATQALAVTVTNVNETPSLTSGAAASVAEETIGVIAVISTDPDTDATATYSIVGGADADRFSISAAGVVAFQAAPNFESPTDAGANNVYDVMVQVSDGSLSATQALAVSVTNVNEAPSFTSGPAMASVAE